MAISVLLIRILLTALLSGLVGLEREFHGCAAGLRTHILVAIGSALFMITSIQIAVIYAGLGGIDPSRIAAGVVSGIGFLGAGAIIRYGASIRGLTTAASIWAVAAVGLAVGCGMYAAGAITTVVALAVLVLSRMEERMALKRHGRKLCVTATADSSISESELRSVIEAYAGRIKHVTTDLSEDDNVRKMTFDLILPRMHHKEVIAEIISLDGVEKAKWE